jgi:hypothetical protein
MVPVTGWRVVLVGGETLAIVTDTETWRSDPRTWYTASHDRTGTGSYDGTHAAVVELAHSKKWAVREVVPPGELTTAEAIAAERQRVADVLAETVREFEKRAASCEGLKLTYEAKSLDPNRTLDDQIDASIDAARTSGKANAYEHAVEILRAEFATIGGDRG